MKIYGFTHPECRKRFNARPSFIRLFNLVWSLQIGAVNWKRMHMQSYSAQKALYPVAPLKSK